MASVSSIVSWRIAVTIVSSSSLQVGEDAGDLDRVAEIGVARGAGLGAMRLHREDIGAVDQRLVGVGVIGPDLLDQFILPQHRPNVGAGGSRSQVRKKGPGQRVAGPALERATRVRRGSGRLIGVGQRLGAPSLGRSIALVELGRRSARGRRR